MLNSIYVWRENFKVIGGELVDGLNSCFTIAYSTSKPSNENDISEMGGVL